MKLNGLVSGFQLKLVNSRDESNFVVYFGDGAGYLDIESNAKPYIQENRGFFWVYWNSDSELQSGSIFVDTERTENIVIQQHILREELTQALGIMNDSYNYADSIFYQRYSTVTEFSEIDKFVIATLYKHSIRPGMNKKQVKNVLRVELN